MTRPRANDATRNTRTTRLKQTLLSSGATKRIPNSENKLQSSPMPAKGASPTFYLITATRDHVLSAKSSGIVQANHGVKAPMQRMRSGDGVVFYSPRHQLKGKEACQRFTAIATVGDGDLFQQQITETFKPWRRKANFEATAKEVDVKTVIGKLDCLKKGEAGWGWVLRRGCLKIGDEDWRVLWDAMVGSETR